MANDPTPSRLSRSIAGKAALITGAASGMGRATAVLFAEQAARVAVTDIDGEGAQAVASAINAAGGDAIAYRLDVSSEDEAATIVDQVAERLGGLDILINNAGVSLATTIDGDAYGPRWERTLAVLLTGQTLTIRAALPHLRQSPTPRIVNVASTEGLGATAGVSPYTAAKHGVVGLTRSLAVELGKEGITVNCVCPGPIHTAMTASIPDQAKETYARRRTALRRYGEPEEVAHMTLSLVLPAASFVTGVALPVDGGLTIRRA